MHSNIIPSEKGFVENAGTKVYYEYYGNKNAPVLICCNTFLADSFAWHRFLPQMLTKLDILLWDYPGQGNSTFNYNQTIQNIEQNIFIEQNALFLKTIIETLHIENLPLYILGISSGGFIALHFAKTFPHLIKKMALVSTLILFSYPIYYRIALHRHLLEEGYISTFVTTMYADLYSHTFLNSIESRMGTITDSYVKKYKPKAKIISQYYTWKLNLLKNIEHFYTSYGAIETPILYIDGEEDILSPSHLQSEKEKIFPKAQFVQIPNCGHYPLVEKPKEFFTLIDRFFQ